MEIHIGNCWENLADLLIEKVSSLSFFEKKYLILPSNFQKNWLFERWANSEKQIVMGVKTFSIQEAILHFLQATTKQEVVFPSCIELKIALHQELSQICEIKNDARFNDIQKYLAEDREKKILYLTSELYDLFTFYGQYGLSLLLKENKERLSWQEQVWKNVFSKNGYHIPIKMLSKPISLFKESNVKIFFFGFSYLPPIYFDFFYRLSKYAKVCQILYSSTQGFLEDSLSSYEEKKLRKEYEEVDWLNEYLDTNRLVGNWAKLEKEFQRTLGSYELEIQEHYYEKPSQSCLGSIQKDIFHLEENPENMSFEKDKSVLLEKVSGTKMQEVIALQKNIYQFLKEGIPLNEIFVLAPDINEYVPFIHMLFDSIVHYKISDINLLQQSHFAKGMISILELAKSSWEENEINALLNNSLLQKKFSFTQKEADIFADWMQKAHVYFGYDEHHNQELIGKKEARNTFKECLQRLIASLVLYFDDQEDCYNFAFPLPIENMDLSGSEVLNTFVFLIQSLRKNTVFHNSLTLQEWGNILETLAENFFLVASDDYLEKSAQEVFYDIIRHFKSYNEEQCFEFTFVFSLIKTELQKITTSYQPHLCDAIQFSSLNSGNIKPAKVMYLLGMHADNEETNTSLNLLKGTKEFYPTFAVKKRYHLLQLVNLCKNKLVFSFPKKGIDEAAENTASTALQEFISYMERVYPSYSLQKKDDIQTLRETYNKSSFTEFGYASSEIFKEPYRIITLSSLKLLLKDPFRLYLQQKHNIYLEYDDSYQQDDVFLSALNKYIFTQQTLSSDLEKQVSIFDKLRMFPTGVFKDIAESSLFKEINSYLLFFTKLGISPSELQTIEFRKECKKPYFESTKAVFPAIEIPLHHKVVYLVGKIQHVSSKGLVLFKEDKTYSQLENWAALLALQSVQEHLSVSCNNMIFLKSQTQKKFSDINVKDALKRLVQYYLVAEKNLSPMKKKIAEPLLTKEEEKFVKNYLSLVKEKQNWVLNHITTHDPKNLFKNWSDFVRSSFQELT
ncbi:MAG: exodeoxyribonuclease V subunit gamma [Chlamydiota bacterium]|jgi:exonuclease V gamma subunit